MIPEVTVEVYNIPNIIPYLAHIQIESCNFRKFVNKTHKRRHIKVYGMLLPRIFLRYEFHNLFKYNSL